MDSEKDGKRRRAEARLRDISLVERLVVAVHGDHYEILDGHLRYEILRELGLPFVPRIDSNPEQ